MSNRRMFNKQIIYRFDFMKMSLEAQRLYQFLIFEADDDGFVGDPARIIRMADANKCDYSELKEFGFVHEFKSGVCVIVHWLYHNSIIRDWYTPTMYAEERSQLRLRGNEYQPIV